MPEIISRKEARARGLKRYFTGKPCKRGHICERVVSNTCISCRKDFDAKREFDPVYRKWKNARNRRERQQNPERVRERLRRFRRNHPEADKKWRVSHRTERKEDWRRFYYDGPKNPTGEKQWLRKNQAILRSLKRVLKDPQAGLPSGLIAEFQT